MKSFRLLAAGAFVFALLTLVVGSGVVSAQSAPVVECGIFQEFESEQFLDSTTENCDLAIQKEVSVNSGAFADANTSAEAAQGAIGNNVVWRVTVTNPIVPDDGYFALGNVRATDVLPTGVTYVSSSATQGSYDSTTNIWQFTMPPSPAFPIVLTINTTAANVGLFENIASFSEYACEGWCDYGDFNPENNTDNAFLNISAAPVVLAETTPVVLAATGSGVAESLVAGSLILATLGTLGYNRLARKNS